MGIALGIQLVADALLAVVIEHKALLGVLEVQPLSRQLRIGAGGGDPGADAQHQRVVVAHMVLIAHVLHRIADGLQGHAAGALALKLRHHGGGGVEDTGAVVGDQLIGGILLAGRIGGKVGVDEPLGIPLLHHFQIFLILVGDGAVEHLTVPAEHFAAGLEACGQIAADGAGIGDPQGRICALVVLEGGEHIVVVVIGNGGVQLQVVQPVLTDHGAKVDAVALLIEGIGHGQGAVLQLGVLFIGGKALPNGLVVGHELVIQVVEGHEHFILHCGSDAAGDHIGILDHVREVAAGGHQVQGLVGIFHIGQHQLNVDAGECLGLLEPCLLAVVDHVLEGACRGIPETQGLPFFAEGVVLRLRGRLGGSFLLCRCLRFLRQQRSLRQRFLCCRGLVSFLHWSRCGRRCAGLRRRGCAVRAAAAACQQSQQHGRGQNHGCCFFALQSIVLLRFY